MRSAFPVSSSHVSTATRKLGDVVSTRRLFTAQSYPCGEVVTPCSAALADHVVCDGQCLLLGEGLALDRRPLEECEDGACSVPADPANRAVPVGICLDQDVHAVDDLDLRMAGGPSLGIRLEVGHG